ncbi:cytochrome P450 monooxygenase-like protein [Bipolaris maydis]|nr:cytochrome P450 monooxygenase-like protein [Bipolaris maydis]
METLESPKAPFPISLPPLILNPITTSILLAAVIAVFILSRKSSKYPHANPPAWYAPKTINQLDSMQNGMKILSDARKRFPNQPFRMIRHSGEVLVFPERFANAIRNEEGLNFAQAAMQDFHGHLPGFTAVKIINHQGQVLQNLARKPLTKLLNTVTQPLASEAIFAIDHILGHPTDTLILDSMLDLIARLSSRVFLGDKLCRNEDWLKTTKEYTVDMSYAAFILTPVPASLRFIVSMFSKQCGVVREHLRRGQELIRPIIEERRLLKEQARKEGKPIPAFNDAIEWGEQECKGISYNPASLQLSLSFAAIHTTSDLLSKLLILLAREPEQIKPLREEIICVLKRDGWSKNSLFNMKLVDSAMKEAQRLMPIEQLSMRRIATKDVHIAEGNITIRKGQHIVVDDTHGTSLPGNEDLEKFDIYRWLRLREKPGFANKAHFVSTSPEHLAFGHGKHACPGRFFAANEIKIALCFLLLRYDWELAPGTTADLSTFGFTFLVNQKSTLRYRRREAEIDLEALKFE